MTSIHTKQLSADGFQWHLHSPRIGTITNELRHFSQVAYFQFPDWITAHDFWKGITEKCGTRAQVRQSERFNTGWEVKVWSLPEALLSKLIERDRTRKPKSLPLPPIRRDWSMSESYETLQYEVA